MKKLFFILKILLLLTLILFPLTAAIEVHNNNLPNGHFALAFLYIITSIYSWYAFLKPKNKNTCRECGEPATSKQTKCEFCGIDLPVPSIAFLLVITLILPFIAIYFDFPIISLILYLILLAISHSTSKQKIENNKNTENKSSFLNISIQHNSDSDYIDEEEEEPISDYSHIYSMENGEAIIWQGKTKPASFKLYSETKRTEGIITQLSIHEDGEFYFNIVNQETGELLKFKEQDIQTAIVVGSTRYDFQDLCRKVFKLDLSELFEYAKSVRKEASEPRLIKEFPPIETTFTYTSYQNGRTKRTVMIDKYLRNKYGTSFLSGYCLLRKEYRTFRVKNIDTMLSSTGHKKYHFDDWLVNVLGMEK